MRAALADFPPPPEGRTGWPWSPPSTRRPSQTSAAHLWPKISIVTPSFNQGAYLEETIRSVLLQGYPNLEYFVIDGGSNDSSVDILRKYDRFLTAWVSEPDAGQSDAINKGLRLCTGELFNWLNSDDTYEPEALFRVARTARAYPEKTLVCAVERGMNHVGEESTGISSGTTLADTLEETLLAAHIDQPATFFRREALERIGPLDAALHYKMDSDLWLRYLLLFGMSGIAKTNDILVNFRYHEHSKSVAFQERFDRERILLQRRLARSFHLTFVQENLALLHGGEPDDDQLAYECRVAVDRRRLALLFRKKFASEFFQRNLLDLSRREIRASPRSLIDMSDLPYLRFAWAMTLLPNPAIALLRRVRSRQSFIGGK
ncbi:MAG: glycosyltransferase family 2 protein [bacterium]